MSQRNFIIDGALQGTDGFVEVAQDLHVAGKIVFEDGAELSTALSSIADLSDVELTGLEDGQVLVYNSETGAFEPGTASSGSSVDLSAIAQDILPAEDGVYSLGSPDKKWAELYVSANTIYIDDQPISKDPLTGRILLGGSNPFDIANIEGAEELGKPKPIVLPAEHQIVAGDVVAINENGNLEKVESSATAFNEIDLADTIVYDPNDEKSREVLVKTGTDTYALVYTKPSEGDGVVFIDFASMESGSWTVTTTHRMDNPESASGSAFEFYTFMAPISVTYVSSQDKVFVGLLSKGGNLDDKMVAFLADEAGVTDITSEFSTLTVTHTPHAQEQKDSGELLIVTWDTRSKLNSITWDAQGTASYNLDNTFYVYGSQVTGVEYVGRDCFVVVTYSNSKHDAFIVKLNGGVITHNATYANRFQLNGGQNYAVDMMYHDETGKIVFATWHDYQTQLIRLLDFDAYTFTISLIAEQRFNMGVNGNTWQTRTDLIKTDFSDIMVVYRSTDSRYTNELHVATLTIGDTDYADAAAVVADEGYNAPVARRTGVNLPDAPVSIPYSEVGRIFGKTSWIMKANVDIPASNSNEVTIMNWPSSRGVVSLKVNAAGEVVFSGAGSSPITSSLTIKDGNSHEITVYRDGYTNITLLIDGISQGTATPVNKIGSADYFLGDADSGEFVINEFAFSVETLYLGDIKRSLSINDINEYTLIGAHTADPYAHQFWVDGAGTWVPSKSGTSYVKLNGANLVTTNAKAWLGISRNSAEAGGNVEVTQVGETITVAETLSVGSDYYVTANGSLNNIEGPGTYGKIGTAVGPNLLLITQVN